jgi:RNA polymerase sigma-70 factor (ECF subfamily)
MNLSNKADVGKLVNECINGNKKYQQLFYKTFYSKMLVICMRFSSNTEEAKDILHEGFIKIFNKLPGFKNVGSLEGWVRRIIVNNAIDYVRKKKEVFIHYDGVGSFDNIKSNNEEEIDNEMLIGMKAELILKLIQKLSPAYRTVFNLYVIENYSHKEIAEILGINIGTSKSNLAKAKIKLREFYKEHEYELER